MILPLLLQAASPAAPGTADEVVIIGRKLQTWRAHFDSKRGRCETQQSSGDIEIDAIGCQAIGACWPDALPRYEATRARGLDRDARQRLMAAANDSYGACMMAKRTALIQALAEQRAGGGQ